VACSAAIIAATPRTLGISTNGSLDSARASGEAADTAPPCSWAPACGGAASILPSCSATLLSAVRQTYRSLLMLVSADIPTLAQHCKRPSQAGMLITRRSDVIRPEAHHVQHVAFAHRSRTAAVRTSCIRCRSDAGWRCSVLLRHEAPLLDRGLALPFGAVCVEVHQMVSNELRAHRRLSISFAPARRSHRAFC
jgi:hypothetical protein